MMADLIGRSRDTGFRGDVSLVFALRISRAKMSLANWVQRDKCPGSVRGHNKNTTTTTAIEAVGAGSRSADHPSASNYKLQSLLQVSSAIRSNDQ